MNDTQKALDALDILAKILPQFGVRDFSQEITAIRKALEGRTPPEVDVEALKRKDCLGTISNGRGQVWKTSSFNAGWNDCIDHLIETGILRGRE